MSEFKVGDRVRFVISNGQIDGLVEGNEYIVSSIVGDFIRVVGNKWDYFQYRFEKVNKFKGNIK